jgi:hypothetical protein
MNADVRAVSLFEPHLMNHFTPLPKTDEPSVAYAPPNNTVEESGPGELNGEFLKIMERLFVESVCCAETTCSL